MLTLELVLIILITRVPQPFSVCCREQLLILAGPDYTFEQRFHGRRASQLNEISHPPMPQTMSHNIVKTVIHKHMVNIRCSEITTVLNAPSG